MKKSILIVACTIFAAGVSVQNVFAGDNGKGDGLGTTKLNVGKTSTLIPNDQNVEFLEYVKKAKQEIEDNDKNISELQMNLTGENKQVRRKLSRKIDELVIDNNELKTDLNNYINYGIGNWKVFRNEFNNDLVAVVQDLSQLVKTYVPESIFADNSK